MDLAGAVKSRIEQAIELTRAKQFGEAGQSLLQALEVLELSASGRERWDELGRLAHVCSTTGHPDLALMATQSLLEAGDRRTDPSKHCSDLLTLANSWSQLGRVEASVSANELALRHALEHERFGDAASASTNLAGAAANTGQLARARVLLEQSLEFLAKGDHPETDAITRLFLIQVVDAMKADPEPALDAATALFDRLERHLDSKWKPAAPAFKRLVDRYLQAHPELDADAWKLAKFPRVFGRSRR